MPDEEELSLVFPFVVCESHGGPYDDLSFCAGYEAGYVNGKLQDVAPIGAGFSRTVRKELVPQLDLIAAHFHYITKDITELDDSPVEGWVSLLFEPQCICATTIEELEDD